VLFALNHEPHPGEKRLVAFALAHCWLPEGFVQDVQAVLGAASSAQPQLLGAIDALADGLDVLLAKHGYEPRTGLPRA